MDRPQEIRSCHVCVNTSCAEAGSRALLDALRERLAPLDVRVKAQICFGACWMGPNVVLYPQGIWYSNVQPGDLGDIVAHIEGGPPVARLLDHVDPQLNKLVLAILDAGLD